MGKYKKMGRRRHSSIYYNDENNQYFARLTSCTCSYAFTGAHLDEGWAGNRITQMEADLMMTNVNKQCSSYWLTKLLAVLEIIVLIFGAYELFKWTKIGSRRSKGGGYHKDRSKHKVYFIASVIGLVVIYIIRCWNLCRLKGIISKFLDKRNRSEWWARNINWTCISS